MKLPTLLKEHLMGDVLQLDNGVRAGTLDDVPAILAMCRLLHAESPHYQVREYSEEKVRQSVLRTLSGTLTTEAPGGWFIAVRNGEAVGMMAGFIVETVFGYDKIASDYVFYVKPEHRGGRLAIPLIRAFEHWAYEQGASDIIPGISSGIVSERTRELYLRLGYEHYGYLVWKKIK